MALTNGTYPSSPNIQILDDFVASHPCVKLIHIQYIDLSGVFRSRLVPLQTLRETLQNNGVHPGSGSIADLAMPSDNAILEEIVPYIIPVGQIKPDVSTIRMCHDSANLGNTASVIANVDIMDLDARALLQKTVAEAESQHGLTFKVGLELEFCFMEKDRSTVPAEQQHGLHNSAILSRSRYWPVLNEIVAALAEEGIYAIECHKEYEPAQFEIALQPSDPVRAVDICMYTRELIRDISYRHGLIATFYPSPFAGGVDMPSGAHVHISATPSTSASSFEPDQFLGGLLSHIPALCAIGMPSVDSYGRTAHGTFGCGSFVAWGTNNRSTAIRKVSNDHWEVRCNDGCSNLYMMVVGIIAAGLDAKPLTLKDIDSKCAPF